METEKIVEETEVISKKTKKTEDIVTVGVDTSVEDVIKYDLEKKKIVFEVNPDKAFLVLPKKVLSDLSKQTREAYYMAKGLWSIEQDEQAGDVISDFVVSPENVRLTMTSKTSVGVKPHLRKHFARPDKVSQYLMKGYKVAGRNDLKNPSDDHALRVKIGGYDDVVLMVRDKELDEQYKKSQQEYIESLVLGSSLNDGKSNIQKQGMEVVKENSFVTITEDN